jgi:hypothetical protein
MATPKMTVFICLALAEGGTIGSKGEELIDILSVIYSFIRQA